jgi:hypothetical protein
MTVLFLTIHINLVCLGREKRGTSRKEGGGSAARTDPDGGALGNQRPYRDESFRHHPSMRF